MTVPTSILMDLFQNAGRITDPVKDLRKARGMMSGTEQTALADLLRREEMNALGLNAAEMAAMQRQALGPQRAAMREGRERRFDVLGSSGVGPADVAKAMAGEAEREARALSEGAAAVAQADAAERQREEQQLLELSGKQAKQEAAMAGARMDILAGSLGALVSGAQAGQAAKALKDVATGVETEAANMDLTEVNDWWGEWSPWSSDFSAQPTYGFDPDTFSSIP